MPDPSARAAIDCAFDIVLDIVLLVKIIAVPGDEVDNPSSRPLPREVP
jgi:hypothetical protein